MPSFRGALTEQQIKMVVTYLRTFCTEDGRRPISTFPSRSSPKKYPENEILFRWKFSPALDKERDTQFRWTFEKRIGARGQIELNIPVNIRDPKEAPPLVEWATSKLGRNMFFTITRKVFLFSAWDLGSAYPRATSGAGWGKERRLSLRSSPRERHGEILLRREV